MTAATCPTTGLAAGVCFGACCIPVTPDEAAAAVLRDEIAEALWDAAEEPSDPIGALEAVARRFAARQLREAADAADRDWFHAATTRALRDRADALDGGAR